MNGASKYPFTGNCHQVLPVLTSSLRPILLKGSRPQSVFRLPIRLLNTMPLLVPPQSTTPNLIPAPVRCMWFRPNQPCNKRMWYPSLLLECVLRVGYVTSSSAILFVTNCVLFWNFMSIVKVSNNYFRG